ncbi:MAG: hypothetical protein KGI59_00200 [Patescibacteria group bacterium]|nr:hypothetical protein [Patescibacteria group bacterium]MDE2172557.1 hypothetical protein [Patescibacteria group bacterium]
MRRRTQGIIIVDILLALALSAVYIAILGDISENARDTYARAAELSHELDRYGEGAATTSSRAYGNDRLEYTDTVGSLAFTRVSAKTIFSASTPLCSVGMNSTAAIGSYAYAEPRLSMSLTITPVIVPVDPLLPLTSLQVRGGLAYISADSSKASDPDFLVFDIADGAHPHLLASINTGPGISDFALMNRYVFAAADSTAAELHIMYMNSPGSVSLVKKFRLQLPFASATPPVGSAIAVDRNTAYLGTTKWDGAEFNAIDITDPANPIEIGSFETGSKIRAIFVDNGYAYMADADQYELRVVNVSDPGSPRLAASFAPSGWQRQEGATVSLFEGALSFGRTSGGFDIPSDAEAFTWDASSTQRLESPISLNVPGGVYGLARDRAHLYLATRQVNRELQIFDTALSTSTMAPFSLPVAPQSLVCDNNTLYVLAATAPVIYEIRFN